MSTYPASTGNRPSIISLVCRPDCQEINILNDVILLNLGLLRMSRAACLERELTCELGLANHHQALAACDSSIVRNDSVQLYRDWFRMWQTSLKGDKCWGNTKLPRTGYHYRWHLLNEIIVMVITKLQNSLIQSQQFYSQLWRNSKLFY